MTATCQVSCAFLAAAIIGCTSEPKELERCPTGGIGAKHLAKYPDDPSIGDCTGMLCGAQPYDPLCNDSDGCTQIYDYQRYSCAEPQICPDIGGTHAVFLQTFDSTTVTILLTNCSTGTQPLEISKVMIYGDTRCAFSSITDQQISARKIAPGQTAAITTVYKPQPEAEDYAEIRISSNARNAPELHIMACGTTPTKTDGGLRDASSAPDSYSGPKLDTRFPLTGQWQCRSQTEIAPCHAK